MPGLIEQSNGMVEKLISMHMKGTVNLCGLSGCHLSSVSQYTVLQCDLDQVSSVVMQIN